MRLISVRKRRERARAARHGFPVMLRIVGGSGYLAPGMVLGIQGISGTPTKAGMSTFTIRAVHGPTDFREPAERVLAVQVKEPADPAAGG